MPYFGVLCHAIVWHVMACLDHPVSCHVVFFFFLETGPWMFSKNVFNWWVHGCKTFSGIWFQIFGHVLLPKWVTFTKGGVVRRVFTGGVIIMKSRVPIYPLPIMGSVIPMTPFCLTSRQMIGKMPPRNF